MKLPDGIGENISRCTGKNALGDAVSHKPEIMRRGPGFLARLFALAPSGDGVGAAEIKKGDGGALFIHGRPSAAGIKQVISLVAQGKLVLLFPNGTRSREQVEAKRGAATIALQAKAQIVPAQYEGPAKIRFSHLLRRPAIRVTFGVPIVIQSDTPADKEAASMLTAQLDEAKKALNSVRL
ncbi:MAG: 1-acyl-sn-glycerol-3-phosphate acyltransferase [Nitrosomonadales bacterium]|nr:1-acyl-sn-glycerol-3-phosphate acyltransferase [Nitrosomonadales bacterium]